MLEKVRALTLKFKAKQEARKIAKSQYEAALKEIDEEFGDVEKELQDERDKIKAWMIENNFKTQYEKHASVELRKSAPKYIVKDDKQLLLFLMAEQLIGALDFKKSPVNVLAKEGSIPPELVEVVTEDELAVTVTEGE